MPVWILVTGLSIFFVGLAATIVLVGTMTRERSQVSASLSAIEAISGPVPEDMRTQLDQPFKQRVADPTRAWLVNAARTLAGVNWGRNMSRRLEMAGNPPGWDTDRILAWKAISAVALAGIVGGLLTISGRPFQAVLWGLVFGVVGFFLPDLLVMNKAQHRSDQLRRALPDSVDLLTVSVESGLAFDAAMAQVAQNTEGPLAEEFSRVLHEMQIGSGRSEALRAFADRTDVEDVKVFLNSMIQAEKLGIPIADVLRVQAGEMRLKRSQRVEEQAMKLPVKMVFPVMFGIMPSLFIVILGPAMLSIYDKLIA